MLQPALSLGLLGVKSVLSVLFLEKGIWTLFFNVELVNKCGEADPGALEGYL